MLRPPNHPPSLGHQPFQSWCRRVYIGWAIVLALCVPGLVHADHMPNTLFVTITDTPDPAPTLGSITYAVNVQNSGPKKVTNMVVVSTLPQAPSSCNALRVAR